MVSIDDLANARESIRVNREFISNEIEESESQYEKHDEPRISTLLGIKIVSSDVLENANDSIRFNWELDSSETKLN
jgi:hypothetical protein